MALLWDAHCEIIMGNDVARDIHCDITMSNDIAMCTYHGVFFYYVFSALCLIMILLWVVCNKTKTKFMFDQSGLENTFVVFPYSLVLVIIACHWLMFS